MSGETLVCARQLTRRYGAHTAVAKLNLELRAGEVLGLLGPNGAGKTTTLRMLAGCLAPSAGTVHIRGVDMAQTPARAKAALGYLPERPPLYPEQTVDEYLGFCARLHRIRRRGRAAALAAAKRDCGLEAVGRRLIGLLSKGFQQRVGIAQAILHRPDVVILDEPTAGLDPNQIREIRGLIRRLGEHRSVLLSSHILSEIQASCGRVAIIHNGRLVFDRAMREIEQQPGGIVLGLRRPPPADTLTGIAGVDRATQTGPERWRLECAHGSDPREAVAARAAANDWGLFELRETRKTLEETFIELTSGAPQPGQPA